MDFSEATFDASKPAPESTACAACQKSLATGAQYWTAGPAVLCGTCAQSLSSGAPKEGSFLRMLKAFFFGSAAGALGAAGYALVIYFLHIEFALITIFIGWFVGRGVRRGSGGFGGRGYQVMGALLTYIWCTMAYAPSLIAEALNEPDHLPLIAWLFIAPVLVLAMPFSGSMGPLGLIILAFGVWRGWREPAPLKIVVEGPFEIGAAAPVPMPAVEAEAPAAS